MKPTILFDEQIFKLQQYERILATKNTVIASMANIKQQHDQQGYFNSQETDALASAEMQAFIKKVIVDAGGEFIIDAVLVRPGYHQLMARIGKQFLIGLPGNPQSAVIGLLSLATSLIAGTTGNALPLLQERILGTGLKGPAREVRLVLCSESGNNTVTPLDHLDSSMLRGFVKADGYAVLPAGGAESGQIVQWLDLP